jgi:hypothetical protein
MALMGGALLMAGPVAAQAPAWEDCAGRVIILGQHSQAEGALFSHWATLSNPGMRPVRVQPGFGEVPPAAPARIEAGRMLRLRLGEGPQRLSAEQIAQAMRLRCQIIPTQP